jgi:AcrR family transcriptional regulator
MTLAPSLRKRGRPVTTDPSEVNLVALRLFMARGVENVTMDEVASAAKISRSNLFRVFPSKGAIVWGGMQAFTELLEEKLASAQGKDVVRVLHRAWINAMEELDESAESIRLRFKLIGSSREVYGWGQAQFREARAVIEKAVARIEGGSSIRSNMVAAALVAASVQALIWWAQNDDPRTPAELLDQSFVEFEKIFASVAN